jgi:ubiquinone/menaquinone biosynthesis C-methylase UbiE
MTKYDQSIASDYARLRRIHPRLLENVIEQGEVQPNSRVLEIACGTGNYIRALHDRTGCEAWGIDPSEEMLEQAQMRGTGIRWVQALAENATIVDRLFDLIFCVDAVHHFLDRAIVFREVNRLLSTGGRFCIATDSEEIIRTRKPLSTYWPETIAVDLIRYPRIDVLKAELRKAGFLTVWQEEVCFEDWLSDISSYKASVFSCLRLLPEQSYQRGLAKLEAALAQGPILQTSRYTVLLARSDPRLKLGYDK